MQGFDEHFFAHASLAADQQPQVVVGQRALDTLFEGDVAAANRWLKRHGRSLYAQFG